jgi:uncharacterized protein (DUF111 family)
VLPRREALLQTPWGPVRIKQAQRPDGSLLSKPEADDLAVLARRHRLPMAQLRQAVLALLDDGVLPEDASP